MAPTRTYRALIITGFLVTVLAVSAGIWRYGYLRALDQLAQRGQADLALVSDRLTGQLKRFQEMAVLLADHPDLQALVKGQGEETAQALLLSAADKTAALELMFVAPSGQVLASAYGEGQKDLSKSPVFERAMQGALGTGHGILRPLGKRAYLFGAPSFGADGRVIGALIVAVDIDLLEADWHDSNTAVVFIDDSGEVFITNRSELLFWRRPEGQPGLEPATGKKQPFNAKRVGPHEVWRLGWGPYLPDRALHLSRPLPVIGMTAEALVDVAPARRLAGLQAAVVAALFLAFGTFLYLVTERRRALAMANAVLESRVAKRTAALSDTNVQLRREIAERRQAEDALKQAQAELVHAGKLSALGQLTAGLSHELNQPLMAIQSFAENGAQYLERGKVDVAGANMARISDLAGRMARIIKNLRAFSRQESREVTAVDIVSVIESALELAAAKLQEDLITVKWNAPQAPVWVQGGEVRLAQVMINLITNASDAMAGQELRVVGINLNCGTRITIEVIDTGPGITEPEKIFEPFYSTKNIGAADGMGLGLSISYGLVQSFGGNIRGANRPKAGAIFSIELDRWQEGETA